MIVNCFTLNSLRRNNLIKNNSINNNFIKLIYKEFGKNIPKYLQYNSGQSITYLFCVNHSVDIINICKRYNYIINNLYKMEIDDNTYNNNYTIFPTYNSTGVKYILEI
jgi:hypothetical protein